MKVEQGPVQAHERQHIEKDRAGRHTIEGFSRLSVHLP